MQTNLRMTTSVLPGHRIELTAPEVPENAARSGEAGRRFAPRQWQIGNNIDQTRQCSGIPRWPSHLAPNSGGVGRI